MNVSAWSIRNPTPSILLFIMLTLVGVLGFNAMKVQQFPDIELPTVTAQRISREMVAKEPKPMAKVGSTVLAKPFQPVTGKSLTPVH